MHDNMSLHWLYGIEEKLLRDGEDITMLKHLIETVLRGNTGSLGHILNSPQIEQLSTANKRKFNSVSKTLMSYWMDNISNADVLATITSFIDDPFIRNIESWNRDNKVPGNVFNDHFSRGQMQSKLWLVDTLTQAVANQRLGTVLLLGGWYGTVHQLLLERLRIRHTYNFEIDADCVNLADRFNQGSNYTSVYTDANQISWVNQNVELADRAIKPQTVINTSCEHMADDWFHAIPKGKFVALQTNNFFECDQHINCVESLTQAEEKYPFTQLVYKGQLPTERYYRYMLIGVK